MGAAFLVQVLTTGLQLAFGVMASQIGRQFQPQQHPLQQAQQQQTPPRSSMMEPGDSYSLLSRLSLIREFAWRNLIISHPFPVITPSNNNNNSQGKHRQRKNSRADAQAVLSTAITSCNYIGTREFLSCLPLSLFLIPGMEINKEFVFDTTKRRQWAYKYNAAAAAGAAAAAARGFRGELTGAGPCCCSCSHYLPLVCFGPTR